MSDYDLVKYVFELPSRVIYAIGELIDPGNLWEEVARVMPQMNANDIDACRTQPRPTETLIRMWGAKGYKVLDLFKVFGRVKYVTCMRLLHPHMHKFTEALTRKNIAMSPRATQQHAPIAAAAAAVGGGENTQPPSSAVYSKKATAPAADAPVSAASEHAHAGLENTMQVKYDEIRRATDDFAAANVCGRGGYGVVYRGVWQHMDVAVKRIRSHKDSSDAQNRERVRQSLQELRHLSKYRHPNILTLIVYSMDGECPCLVYQYMSNGSLEDRLLCRNGTPPLQWHVRKTICHGAARGLHYMHSSNNTPLIHGDVKSANILLDTHLEPKIGDFGLSRDGQMELDAADKSPMIASHIKGTLAYLPPEFIRSKILSTKLDVYSFGVVMLEVATGLRAYSDAQQPHSVVAFVNARLAESGGDGEATLALSDKRVALDGMAAARAHATHASAHRLADTTRAIFALLLPLGLKCSVDDYLQRPSLSEITTELT